VSILLASLFQTKPRSASSDILWSAAILVMSSFGGVNKYLAENGLKVSRGTSVDATIIDAPSSTKNKDKKRDPDMHQTRKGNHWYFGMKAHVGVDSKSKLIHSVAVTAANVQDSQKMEGLLHGDVTRVWGDSAYTGQQAQINEKAPKAKNFTNKKAHRHAPLTEAEKSKNRYKSKVREKLEQLFHNHDTTVWIYQSALSWTGKERALSVCELPLINLTLSKKRLLRLTQVQCA
jgi:IS5 family transposase